MCAREPGTCVILAGKRDSRRHSTTSFFENVAVVFFKVFKFCDQERAQPPAKNITVFSFMAKKSESNNEYARKLQVKSRPRI